MTKARKGNNYVTIDFTSEALYIMDSALERALLSIMRSEAVSLQYRIKTVREYAAYREIFRVARETLKGKGPSAATRQHQVPSDNGGPQEVV